VLKRLTAVLCGRADSRVRAPHRESCLAQLEDKPEAGVAIVYGVAAPRAQLDRRILAARKVAGLIKRLSQFRGASSLAQRSGGLTSNSVEMIVFFYDK
jgi:hypothetical protein